MTAPAGVTDGAGEQAPPRIRTLAVAVCVDGDRALVERGHDVVAGQSYYRAIGGGVEFGERAAEAVTREWREELGLTLAELRPLGVLESLFCYEGRPGHEIVFAYRARVVEARVYAQDAFASVDPSGLRHEAVWIPLDTLRQGPVPLHPEGLAALLDARGSANEQQIMTNSLGERR
jgi:ADP-ribose pyrophosphatase YjhB (NUDIX family)